MSGSLRLKLQVNSVLHTIGSEQLELFAVYGQDGSANGSWSKATPVAKLTMTVTNPEAFGCFKPGDYVGVTMTPVGVDD